MAIYSSMSSKLRVYRLLYSMAIYSSMISKLRVYRLLYSMAIYLSMISKLRVYRLLLTVNKWVDQPPNPPPKKREKFNEGHMCDHNHTVQRFITLQVRY